jgi:hypothetical protein
MTTHGLVTLLTDFGLSDPFVGVLHGVLATRAPGVRVIDLAHGIPPQDVAAGAFWLARSLPYFPWGTVHVAVVDPGVGTSRAAAVVEANGHVLVGPDNGLLAEAAALAPGARSFAVDLEKLSLAPRGSTFHARDVFAPVAAELATGRLAPQDVGPPLVLAPSPVPRSDGRTGVVVVVDRYGNLLTNVPASASASRVLVAGRGLRIVGAYAEASPGEAVGLVNAWGFFELAVRDGDAARTLGLGPRAVVRLA